MNNVNFNYWLQGYFELQGDAVETLLDDQVVIIRQHLSLVKDTEQLTGFASWLEGFLDASSGLHVHSDKVKLIKDRLSESFKHAIANPPFVVTGGGGVTINPPSSIYSC